MLTSTSSIDKPSFGGYYNHLSNSTEYRRGISDEEIIKRWLKTLGYSVRDTNREENIAGIDAYVNNIPVDFKSQKYSCRYIVNFCFELQVYSKSRDAWRDSWFVTGKADSYIFMSELAPGEHTLFWIDKEKVQAYGFDYHRQLSAYTQQKQLDAGHDHTNAKLGYIRVENISCIGQVIDKTVSLSARVEDTRRSIPRPITKVHRTPQALARCPY